MSVNKSGKSIEGNAVSAFKEVKLKDIVTDNCLGGNYECVEEVTPLPVIKMGNLDRGTITLEKIEYVSDGKILSNRDVLKKGDILFNTRNTLDLVGKVAMWRGELEHSVFNSNIMRITFSANVLNEYMNYYFNSYNALKQLRARATGTTSVGAIYWRDCKNIKIPLPPLPEQKAIADLLSTWDEAIEKTERLIQAKEAVLKGQIQKLISRRCDSWAHIKPKKIFDTITEKNFPEEELLSVTQDRGVIPRSMLAGRVMSPDGTTASYKLIKRGDFAISLRSFQGGLEYSEYQGIISPAYTVLRPKIEINCDFYRLFFKSAVFIDKYLNLAVIGIRDGKQISIPDFMSISIPYPRLEEQKQVADILLSYQKEIDLLKQLAEKYKSQKCGLMQKMMTGEWRVKLEIINQYMEA
ncbi:MAG: restriction endonuclease subunit S [Chlorobiaceae bacterium]|nr:restriction endonuclease subunit S [Chlorobiaceae bacterium]